MYCQICKTDEKDLNEEGLQHLPIYVSGSEGLFICFTCKLEITNYVRQLQQIGTRIAKSIHKKRLRDNVKELERG